MNNTLDDAIKTTKEIIKDILKEDYSLVKENQLLNYKYEGKTSYEWLYEAGQADGNDEEGNPLYYYPLSMSTYALAAAQTILNR